MQGHTETNPTTSTRPDPAATKGGQLMYEAFYGGAFGGSVVALLFLVLDTASGSALLTPSRMGMAFFTERSPATVVNVHLDMVALYSIAHFAVFMLFGALSSRLNDFVGSWVLLAAILFALMSVTYLVGDLTVLDGAASVVGWHWVLLANAAAAATMGAFMTRARRNA